MASCVTMVMLTISYYGQRTRVIAIGQTTMSSKLAAYLKLSQWKRYSYSYKSLFILELERKYVKATLASYGILYALPRIWWQCGSQNA